MSILCDFDTFKPTLRKCIFLLEEENLSKRNVNLNELSDEVKESLRNLRNFLEYLKQISERTRSYEELLKELQNPETPREYLELIGFLGKMLDAIQIVKPNTSRHKAVVKTLYDSLKRTGHDFILSEIDEGTKKKYEQELVEATATFHLLEIVFSVSKTMKERNPIASLRGSMGKRLPEEYFAELLAGWLVEDVIKSELEKKGFEVELTGVDRERKVFMKKPENMGAYDLKVETDKGTYFLEVQRVAPNELKRKEKGGFFYTTLKKHKYEGGRGKDKVLVLWLGEGGFNFASGTTFRKRRKDSPSYLFFIPNPKENEKVDFNDSRSNSNNNAGKLFVKEEYLTQKALSYKEFKEIKKEDLINTFTE